MSDTNTIQWTSKSDVPRNNKFTYGMIVCDIKADKVETYRTQLTVGVNILDFVVKLRSPTATVTTTNIFFNRVVRTPG